MPPQDRLQHPIDLVPAYRIPQRKLYHQSENELHKTKRQINEYLEAGHICPSSSSFGALVLLVKKKDGLIRICINYHGLNEITVKNTFPLPRIDNLHDRLGKARYFSKLDLYSSYHKIPSLQSDEHKTAFMSRYNTYEVLVTVDAATLLAKGLESLGRSTGGVRTGTELNHVVCALSFGYSWRLGGHTGGW